MRLKKLIKKINKENTPPGGWRPEDKVSSLKLQAPSLTMNLRYCRIKIMKVKDLIRRLKKFDQEKDIVFYNKLLDENHWECDIQNDECNNEDVRICPLVE